MTKRPARIMEAEVKRAINAAKAAGDDDLIEELLEELEFLTDAVSTSVYRCFDDSGRLLYVGVSLSALRRLMEHKESAHWFDQVARIEIGRYPSRAVALAIELRAIRNEKPLYNVVGRAA